MTDLIKQLDEAAKSQEALVANITNNLPTIFEGYEQLTVTDICESASQYLAQIALTLQGDKDINLDQAASVITGLRIIADRDSREALGMGSKQLNLVAKLAGENPKITQKLSQIGNHPSFSTTKQEVTELLTSAKERGDNSIINLLQKLRLGYEQAANTKA